MTSNAGTIHYAFQSRLDVLCKISFTCYWMISSTQGSRSIGPTSPPSRRSRRVNPLPDIDEVMQPGVEVALQLLHVGNTLSPNSDRLVLVAHEISKTRHLCALRRSPWDRYSVWSARVRGVQLPWPVDSVSLFGNLVTPISGEREVYPKALLKQVGKYLSHERGHSVSW